MGKPGKKQEFERIKEEARAGRLNVLSLDIPQVKCMTSSIRREMVHLLYLYGPRSVIELGEDMGRYPEGLYHHLKALLAAGLVRKVGEFQRGRKVETLYDVVATKTLLKPRPWEPAYAKVAIDLLQSDINLIGQLSAQSSKAERGPKDLPYARTMYFELDESRIEALRKKLREIELWLEKQQMGKGTKRHFMMISINPVTIGEEE